jgi:hypothetical protein
MVRLLSSHRALISAIVASSAATSALAAPLSVVSVQYQTNGSALVGTNTAGVEAVSNYNVVPIGYVSGTDPAANNLQDSTATATTISVASYSNGGFDNGSSINDGSAGDIALYRGFALGGFGGVSDVDLSITGLDPTHSYTLYTYVESLFGPGAIVEGDVGVTTTVPVPPATTSTKTLALTSKFLTTATLTSLTPGTSLTYAGSAPGNYFEFDNLLGSSTIDFSLLSPNSTLTGDSGSGFGLGGFQIVDNGIPVIGGTVPEPASLSILVAGISGLMLRSRRRR